MSKKNSQPKNKKKECIEIDFDDDMSSSSSSSDDDDDDDDDYDDDFLLEDEDIVQRSAKSLNGSNLNDKTTITTSASSVTSSKSEDTDVDVAMGQEGNGNHIEDDDVDSIEPTFGGDGDEDSNDEEWGHNSFKTAKTSKTVTSKYSKAAANAVWKKAMEQDENDEDNDDIFFFDAIQKAGGVSGRSLVKVSDAPPTIITDGNNKNETESSGGEDEDEDEGEGWAGKLTNFVGYTIGAVGGALAGSNESTDDDTDQESAPEMTRKSSKNKAPTKKNPPRGSVTGVKVPSRELEIIKRCREQMKIQEKKKKEREAEAARNDVQNIELRRREEKERARVHREVVNYRRMMEGMGKDDKLAITDVKAAAQDYDDRLAMNKTLEEQEKKLMLNERNMSKLTSDETDNEYDDETDGCACRCVIS